MPVSPDQSRPCLLDRVMLMSEGGSLHFFEFQAPVQVPEAEYIRLLGFPKRHVLEGRSRELAEWAQGWFAEHGRPWIFGRSARALELNGDEFRLDGAVFSSGRLRSQFAAAGATEAVLVAVSAGPEGEAEANRRWRDEKPDEYFFLEAYASAVVESLVARAAGRICAWAEQAGMSALPHYSPGYAGWPVAEQPRFWGILSESSPAEVRERLRVMESGMLQPKKSLLGVFGLTRERDRIQPGSLLVPCLNCLLEDCSYRRAPYRHFIRQSARFSKTCA